MDTISIEEATIALTTFVLTTTSEMEDIRKGKLPDACRAYRVLREAYDKLDEQRKKLNELIESVSRQTIPEMLDENDVTTLTIEFDDGLKYRFNKATRIGCSMVDKDGGMVWLKENGHEAIVQETVNASTLASFYKSYLEDKGEELPAEFFKPSSLTYTSMTKA